ncbi:hypothetical protein HMPREF0262_00368 [Clostridium sp. ATCC 29733]|nr:hypothetical protein HMPREF0262_00368 [Clostridium sp. ATCC 29733]
MTPSMAVSRSISKRVSSNADKRGPPGRPAIPAAAYFKRIVVATQSQLLYEYTSFSTKNPEKNDF